MAFLATGAWPVAQLLPATAIAEARRLDLAAPAPPLHSAEAAAVATALPGRRHEFTVGRACAHAALARLGRDGDVIAVGPRRQPLWPPGVVGSIAHGGDWAGAIVALATDASGLGLDIEPLDPPLPPEVVALVVSATETARLPLDHSIAAHAPKLVFMAKECVYKALFPSTGRELEFADVEVDLDLDGRRWDAVVAGRSGQALSGRFEVTDGHLFTAGGWGQGWRRSGPRCR